MKPGSSTDNWSNRLSDNNLKMLRQTVSPCVWECGLDWFMRGSLCRKSVQELTLSENVKKRISKIISASKIISKTMKNCKQKKETNHLVCEKHGRQFKWKVYSNESSSKQTLWLPLALLLLNIYKVFYTGWSCQAASMNSGSLIHFLFIILLIVAGRGHASSRL